MRLGGKIVATNDRVVRRLAAILAIDMVGYSRHIEADEAGTIARQKSHRKEQIDPVLREHGGRIVKTTGDGLLVEFGSVVDALEGAVRMQRAVAEAEVSTAKERRIQYRAGINLGDIVIDDDDILGDGVNIAARLEAMAEPGGIYITASVFEQVVGKLDLVFDDLGELQVKNIQRPVRVYRVRLEIAPSAAQGLFRGVAVAAKAIDCGAALSGHECGKGPGVFRRRRRRGYHYRTVAKPCVLRHRAQLVVHLQGQIGRCKADGRRAWSPLPARGQRAKERSSHADHRPTHRRHHR
jgi:class 3 adenylate cyclase